MYYLIAQFGWFLLAAVIIGLITGWMTCDREPRRWGWLPVGLIVALVAFLLTWFRFINGAPALWIETALLMFAFYLAGCCIGCIVRKAFSGEVPSGVREWHRNLGEAGPGIGSAGLFSGLRGWNRDLTASAPAGAVALRSAAEPAAMPRVEGEDQIAGNRPAGLVSPRGGRADDLKLIRGIGKQNEGHLHRLGIWHFDQIARWNRENVLWVGSYLAFPGRIEREEWVSQARQLAAGQETAFAARVKRGEVPTSMDDGSFGQANVASLGDDGPKGGKRS